MLEENRFQWYVLTAIGGQEESIAQALREKMVNFGYQSKVKEFKVFIKKIVQVDIFNKNDPQMPNNLKNTKTIEWKTLSNGRYQRTKTKIVNRFPGYIFVHCDLDDDIWYAIRNTIGVLGFVGSTGKNTKPIPCSTNEYERLLSEAATTEYAKKIEILNNEKNSTSDHSSKNKNEKQQSNTLVSPAKVGQDVILTSGSFSGTVVKVIQINNDKQTLKVEVNFLGRVNYFDVAFSDVKLAK